MNKLIAESTNIQNKASNPNNSVWLSASAGTGKTKVLIDRILKLILQGNSIPTIVCITYTNTAASEMKERLILIARKWHSMKPEELCKNIKPFIDEEEPTTKQIKIAENLFNILIDNPEDINISTIHSFSQSILAKFPIEAGVPSKFSIITDEEAKELKNKSLLYIVNNMPAHKKEYLQKMQIKETSFSKLVDEFLGLSGILDKIIKEYNINEENINDNYTKALEQIIDVPSHKNLEELKKEIYQPSQSFIDTIYGINKSNSALNKVKDTISNNKDNPCGKEWIEALFTKKMEPLKALTKLGESEVNKELDRVSAILDNIAKIELLDANKKVFDLLISVHIHYTRSKYANGFLDFTDIIEKTAALLKDSSKKEWVLYKLDNRINHVLLDEAQDTSPQQWDILFPIIEEFFSGSGAKEDTNRTTFIVGDIKQSIYSFQGAVAEVFSINKNKIKEMITSSGKNYQQLSMNTSFRSSPSVIDFVNIVTKEIIQTTNLTYQGENLDHNAASTEKGLVHIWPHIEDANDVKDSRFKILANKIVKQIEYLHKSHGINYHDIVILYTKRQNNKAIQYLVFLLKQKKIPVLGIDRVEINNPIIIQDISALIKFTLQNYDDFSLACLLKSPFFGYTDKDLIKLRNAPCKSLYGSLKSYDNEVYEVLSNWIKLSQEVNVYDFLYKAIYIDKNIKKIVERLGAEAHDNILELLNLALQFTQENNNSLQLFLEYLESKTSDIKRDTSSSNTIRFMTVHQSKGLESKVVFLVDDIKKKVSRYKSFQPHEHDNKNIILYSPSKSVFSYISNLSIIESYNEAQNKAEHEEVKRLLYVALTRPKQYLFLCCSKASGNINYNHHWASLIEQSIGNNSDQFEEFQDDSLDEFNTNNMGYKLINSIEDKKEIDTSLSSEEKAVSLENFPDWLTKPIPVEPSPGKPLNPSKITSNNSDSVSPLENITKQSDNYHNIIYSGIIMHSMLEHLNIPSYQDDNDFITQAKNVCQINLQHHKESNLLSEEALSKIEEQIYKIIENPEINFIFKQKNYINEAIVSGSLTIENAETIISGRVDKIIIEENLISIIDYKSSSYKNKISKTNSTQLNIYREVIQKIYPNKNIKAFILYIGNQKLIEVPKDILLN